MIPVEVSPTSAAIAMFGLCMVLVEVSPTSAAITIYMSRHCVIPVEVSPTSAAVGISELELHYTCRNHSNKHITKSGLYTALNDYTNILE